MWPWTSLLRTCALAVMQPKSILYSAIYYGLCDLPQLYIWCIAPNNTQSTPSDSSSPVASFAKRPLPSSCWSTTGLYGALNYKGAGRRQSPNIRRHGVCASPKCLRLLYVWWNLTSELLIRSIATCSQKGEPRRPPMAFTIRNFTTKVWTRTKETIAFRTTWLQDRPNSHATKVRRLSPTHMVANILDRGPVLMIFSLKLRTVSDKIALVITLRIGLRGTRT